MRTKRIALTKVFAALITIAAIIQLVPAMAQAFEMKTYMVPMRDGVELATDVYLPSGSTEKMPTILMRTPYGKDMGVLFATTILSKRFAWVVQDTRGRKESEGISNSFMDDTNDGYDTIEWIVNQPWSDGDVGTTGISAMGITQYVMAANPHPALKTQYVMAAAGSLYHDAAFIGGGFRRALVLKWVGGNKFPTEFLEMMLSNYNYNEVWDSTNLHKNLQNIDYPILHMAGWYDIFLNGNLRAYKAIQDNGADGARGKQFLIIGAWTHGGWCGIAGTKQGQITYPANSKFNLVKRMVPWFEQVMMGKEKGFFRGYSVYYYTMGDPSDPEAPGNEWRRAEDWPPPAERTPWFFHKDGVLSADKPAGQGDVLEFLDDPANPVQSIGGANLVMKAGPHDQREIEKRDDVLVFTSDSLTDPIEITGPLKAVLYISTDVPDTDFAVRFTDVYPDGRSMLVADGLVRASHREGFDKLSEPLEKDKVYRLEVDVTATSIVINKGHRIRVSVAGSNFPRFDINLHNGQFFDLDEGEVVEAVKGGKFGQYVNTPDVAEDSVPAHSKVYLSGENSSYFEFPIVKAAE